MNAVQPGPTASTDWFVENQRALASELGRVRELLARHVGAEESVLTAAGGVPTSPPEVAPRKPDGGQTGEAPRRPTALTRLVKACDLTPFERDMVLLCAGPELDARFGPLLERAGGRPSFSLALAALPDAHWSALAPDAPLRRCQLVQFTPGDSLVTAALRLDERILHHLAGVGTLDERLTPLFRPAPPPTPLAPSQEQLAWRMAEGRAKREDCPLLQLTGESAADQRALAAATAAMLGQRLYLLDARDLPAGASERHTLARLWEREAALGDAALLLDAHEADAPEAQRAAAWFADASEGLFFLGTREPMRGVTRPTMTFALARPRADEQRTLWQGALGPERVARLNGQLDALAAHFAFGPEEVGRAAALADESSPHGVWDAARSVARARLDTLAQRIEPLATWDDLVLPEAPLRTLREMAAHLRQRYRVHEEWGFARRSARGLGMSALFSGASGTGKTLAAEVLARELRLDLFRVDLSAVVSKYIGETEKNLRRVFEAAEAGGAILLFDEADALFGKRSDVKDSHDRYANLEVSYLLQRIEGYRGLAILTTNLRESLDQAFTRRLRFIVHFPFPDAEQRAAIWRRLYPAETPTEGLDYNRLARLSLPGGNLRNIALHAAFLAADAGEPVRMRHLADAARAECAKAEQAVNETEVGAWK